MWFTTLYALFSTISMLTLFPVLQVLFWKTEKYWLSLYTGIGSNNVLIIWITKFQVYRQEKVLKSYYFCCSNGYYIFKNLFNYLASIISCNLKMAFWKIWDSRCMIWLLSCPFHTIRKNERRYDGALGDVNEVQNLFFYSRISGKRAFNYHFALGMMFIISTK
jgi:subfamily B ATP-binding cassette protein MsbA